MDLAGQAEVRQPTDEPTDGETLRRFYETLLESLGPQGWWPARTRWEVIWGAILTQNTTWRNATLALKNLRKAGLLTWQGMRQASLRELEALIRPAGFYRQKAQTLRNFANWLAQAHGGSLGALFSQGVARARQQLLSCRGIGPETADAILLYSGRQPVFVADAYTRRVLSRHELFPPEADYAAAQLFLHQHLPADPAMFKEFHALLVEAAKRYCQRRAALCEKCPLRKFLRRNAKFETRNASRLSSFDFRVSGLEFRT
jgi:endonuclease-3 related protein